jgi:uncharacterized protein with HEPN domain
MSETSLSGKTVPIELLRAAFSARAAAYAQVFDVVRETDGVERAMTVLGEATRRMGAIAGARYSDLAPADLAGLKDRFLADVPAVDDMFAPEIVQCDAERLVIKFHRCPLREAWQAMGRPDDEVELLCKAGSAVDRGVFEAAGFTFDAENWQAAKGDCCFLKISPGRQAA